MIVLHLDKFKFQRLICSRPLEPDMVIKGRPLSLNFQLEREARDLMISRFGAGSERFPVGLLIRRGILTPRPSIPRIRGGWGNTVMGDFTSKDSVGVLWSFYTPF